MEEFFNTIPGNAPFDFPDSYGTVPPNQSHTGGLACVGKVNVNC